LTATSDTFPEILTSWVNLSAFFARYHAAGLCNDDDNYKYPPIDIAQGLEAPDSVECGPMRQCKEMVVANWIRYAGSVVERLCFEPITEHYGPVRWRQWANKLSHIEIKHANSPELCEATGEARRMMIEMHPELFECEKRSVVNDTRIVSSQFNINTGS
jgi:uncharacterized protein DUF3632